MIDHIPQKGKKDYQTQLKLNAKLSVRNAELAQKLHTLAEVFLRECPQYEGWYNKNFGER